MVQFYDELCCICWKNMNFYDIIREYKNIKQCLFVLNPNHSWSVLFNRTLLRLEFRSHLERRSFMIIKSFVFRDTSYPQNFGFVDDSCKGSGGSFILERIEELIQETIQDFLDSNPGLTEVSRNASISSATGTDDFRDSPIVVTDYIVTCYFEEDNKH